MIFPLVRELAAAGAPVRVPVAVTCRVLGFSRQAYYAWVADPVCARDRLMRMRPTLRSTPTATTPSSGIA